MASGVHAPRKIAPAWVISRASASGSAVQSSRCSGAMRLDRRGGLGQVAGDDDRAVVAPACPGDGAALQGFEAAFDGGGDGGGEGGVGR